VPEGAQGPPEVRYRAHVAFSTANDIIQQLSQIHNRRKAFIYVSNGYDFNPFKDTRAKQEAEKYGRVSDSTQGDGSSDGSNNQTDSDPFLKQSNKFHEADLVSDLSWLTRNANRANVTMYTIDPRGLVGMPDLDEKIDMVEWQNYVRTSQDSLRTIAELTGGYAAVNQNDFDKAIKRIDAETSDYYVIGYYSNNPDPRKRNRSIEVKVTRSDLNVMHRKSYTLKAQPAGTSPSK
ncbi:MAG TPA: VWA domain-containing protein, partial [Vicinamibacterales bacterium]|nr:VWA domain-containing protein [Vicinamibacterales bacterium]